MANGQRGMTTGLPQEQILDVPSKAPGQTPGLSHTSFRAPDQAPFSNSRTVSPRTPFRHLDDLPDPGLGQSCTMPPPPVRGAFSTYYTVEMPGSLTPAEHPLSQAPGLPYASLHTPAEAQYYNSYVLNACEEELGAFVDKNLAEETGATTVST